MTNDSFQIRQLAVELQPPESSKQSIVLTDDDNAKVVLFAFAADVVEITPEKLLSDLEIRMKRCKS
ncbi:hypothetical protein SH139x_005301 [Planctomycetaceae bacterium SH139]